MQNIEDTIQELNTKTSSNTIASSAYNQDFSCIKSRLAVRLILYNKTIEMSV